MCFSYWLIVVFWISLWQRSAVLIVNLFIEHMWLCWPNTDTSSDFLVKRKWIEQELLHIFVLFDYHDVLCVYLPALHTKRCFSSHDSELRRSEDEAARQPAVVAINPPSKPVNTELTAENMLIGSEYIGLASCLNWTAENLFACWCRDLMMRNKKH